MTRKAVLIGATGLIGGHLLEKLLQDDDYAQVVVLVRRETGWSHAKLDERIIDFSQLSEIKIDMKDADVFCTIGTTIKKAGSQTAFRTVDFDYPLQTGQIAMRTGAKQMLIITSIGANPTSNTFYVRTKGQIEQALSGLGLPALQLFRPSLLLGERTEFRLGERIFIALKGVLNLCLRGPWRKYRPILATDVAQAMIQVAKSNREGINIFESDEIAHIARNLK